MRPGTNLIIEGLRKAGKFLRRDFMELEMLQSSARNTKGFCDQSRGRAIETLKQELGSSFKNILFTGDPLPKHDDPDNILLISPIEGIENLSKGLPFFAVMVTLLKKNVSDHIPLSTVVYFPALAEIYYAEKGAGSWVQRLTTQLSAKDERLRVSSCANLENAFICGDEPQKIAKISSNIRNFGSACYSIAALFASGKIDLIYYNAICSFTKHGLELIIKEAGGTVIPSEYGLIAANYNLTENFKQFLAKN